MDCSAPATSVEQSAADALLARTTAAVVKYRDLNAALADGYTPITPPGEQIVHYGKGAFMNDGKLLDENKIESLMYAFDKNKAPYLVAAVYFNNTPAITPPSPGGCQTQWHGHTNLCIAPGRGMVDVVKDGSCPTGSANEATTQMMHVYTIDLPGGPLSHEATPADIKAGLVKQSLGR